MEKTVRNYGRRLPQRTAFAKIVFLLMIVSIMEVSSQHLLLSVKKCHTGKDSAEMKYLTVGPNGRVYLGDQKHIITLTSTDDVQKVMAEAASKIYLPSHSNTHPHKNVSTNVPNYTTWLQSKSTGKYICLNRKNVFVGMNASKKHLSNCKFHEKQVLAFFGYYLTKEPENKFLGFHKNGKTYKTIANESVANENLGCFFYMKDILNKTLVESIEAETSKPAYKVTELQKQNKNQKDKKNKENNSKTKRGKRHRSHTTTQSAPNDEINQIAQVSSTPPPPHLLHHHNYDRIHQSFHDNYHNIPQASNDNHLQEQHHNTPNRMRHKNSRRKKKKPTISNNFV